MNKFFVFLCVMLMSVGISKIVNAQCSINLESGNTPVSGFGDGAGVVETIGQTFKLPVDCPTGTVLESFTFFVDAQTGSGQEFKAYVMEWDGAKAIGPVLYESGEQFVDIVPGFEAFEFNTGTGGVDLTPGQAYVAFISAAAPGVDSTGNATIDTHNNNPYFPDGLVLVLPDNDMVLLDSGNDPNFPLILTEDDWTPFGINVFDLAFNMTFSSLNVSTPSEGIQEEIDELEPINTPKADDANDKLQTALDELAKSPPDEVAALGAIEGAIGDIQAGIDDGDIDATQGIEIIQNLLDISRQLTISAIELAQNTPGSNTDKIDTAFEKLDEGDAFRAIGEYQGAVSKHKDALSEAQSALP